MRNIVLFAAGAFLALAAAAQQLPISTRRKRTSCASR
jgi:hypothetical protein